MLALTTHGQHLAVGDNYYAVGDVMQWVTIGSNWVMFGTPTVYVQQLKHVTIESS